MKDKENMTTAVTASTPDDHGGKGGDAGKRVPATIPERPAFNAYKAGEGYATRLGMMVVWAAYVIFACWHWYYNWVLLRDFLHDTILSWAPVLTNWTYEARAAQLVQISGTAMLAAIGFWLGYYFVYIKRSTAEFLIKTDLELSKVTWPQIVPWFKVDTKVWGATYVVLIVVTVMTIYVFGVDYILQWFSQILFYGS